MWIIGGILNAVGANYIGDPNYIAVSFRNRVQADGGTFEAQNCLISFLTSLQQIS